MICWDLRARQRSVSGSFGQHRAEHPRAKAASNREDDDRPRSVVQRNRGQAPRGVDQATADPTYEVLSPATVPAYIRASSRLNALVDVETLAVKEIGDGNLNLVFICRDAGGRSICLKQPLPYVRRVGEGWPLTPRRADAEARSYTVASAVVPELVPTFIGYDAPHFVLALEDLSDWVVWRSSLNAGAIHPGVAAQMGDYVARMAWATSVFGLPPEEVKRRAAEAVNPDLCRITEDLVFTEPYLNHEHNVFVPELGPLIEAIQADELLVTEVGGLKYRFMTQAEALIHGDLHTGSVMVTRSTDGAGRGKVFDGEFCFYGPVGFDLGALFGNYLLALARARVTRRPDGFIAWVEWLAAETWNAFATAIDRRWDGRADMFLTDGFRDAWLKGTWQDAIGFGGCKAIRRIVGPAKVSDIDTLPEPEHVLAGTFVLRTARRWILERAQIGSPAALVEVASQVWASMTA